MGGPSAFGETERAELPPAARSHLAALERRYACKRFSRERGLSETELRYLLECGRLAPSSFGLEPWRFIALRRASIGEAFVRACRGQDCVATADLAVVILVRRAGDYEPGSPFVRSRADRFPGGWPVFLPDYEGYYRELAEAGRLEEWAQAQSYIACMAMLSAAAAADLDSCPIEGYFEDELLAVLGEEAAAWRVGIVAVFGHGDETPRTRIREEFEAIVEIR